MKIKFTRSILFKGNHCEAGSVADCSDSDAKEILTLNSGEVVTDEPATEPATEPAEKPAKKGK